MNNIIKTVVALMALPLVMSASEYIVKTGALSVDATISKIEKIIDSKKGLGVFTIIDHKKGADKVALKLSETKVIIFGNPKMGTNLMQKDPLTALDLPIRVLVYSKEGKTQIVYRDPKEWSKNFTLKGCKMVEKMTKALDAITTKASQE